MEQKKIERINFLAKKAKSDGLSDEEKAEQQALRKEYLEDFKKNLISTLDNVVIVDQKGNKCKVNRNNSTNLPQ